MTFTTVDNGLWLNICMLARNRNCSYSTSYVTESSRMAPECSERFVLGKAYSPIFYRRESI